MSCHETSRNRNPYPGPRPFGPDEHDLFFGRERERRELLSLIIAHPVVVLYAQSGAGKTSLLNAGLVPLLREKDFEVLLLPRVCGLVLDEPDVQKTDNVYMFSALAGGSQERDDVKPLVSTSLAAFLRGRSHALDKHGQCAPRVIVFDQLEELFTFYPERWKDREGFFRQVNEALQEDPLLRVLFAIREDYLANVDHYAHLLPEFLRTRYRLECLRAEPASLAIEKPLEGTGCSYADGVAAELVQRLLTIQVEPPPQKKGGSGES